VAALGVVYVAVFGIVGSEMFRRAPETFAFAATFDLTISAALVVWWLGVRKGKLPWWFAVATLSWGVAIAKAHVPHAPIGALVAAGGALEVITAGWLLIRIRRVARATRAARDAGPIGALEAGLIAGRFPRRAATIVATELAVVWLAVTGWFRKPGAGFAMRGTGWILIAGTLGFLTVMETAAAHIALSMWTPVAAWISTVSSLYMLVWFAGDAHAIRLYPIAVVGGVVRISVGVRWRVAVPVGQIVDVVESKVVPDGALSLAILEPSVVIALREPIEVVGLLGRRKRADRLALTIDDPAGFKAAIAAAQAAAA
jgi:hypothetical protein